MLDPRQRHLVPSLLDRLTDEAPGTSQEVAENRRQSEKMLRRSVLRDLEWLFNATRLDASQSLSDYPEVARSVINYGLPSLAGRTLSSADTIALERRIKQTILDFEPRLLPSLRVRVLKDTERMNDNALCFEIEGELRAQPAPLHLLLRTEIDLATKIAKIDEL